MFGCWAKLNRTQAGSPKASPITDETWAVLQIHAESADGDRRHPIGLSHNTQTHGEDIKCSLGGAQTFDARDGFYQLKGALTAAR